MLKTHIVDEQEEQIRKQVRTLTESQRKTYFKMSAKQVKDPDTYATLNYIIVAGLHHFYIGRWGRGLLNIAVFTIGILLVYLHQIEAGVAMILGIVLFELYELIRSQIIIKHHNNVVASNILRQILSEDNSTEA